MKTLGSLIAKDRQRPYGMMLSLDLSDVPKEMFRHKKVKEFASKLCDKIGFQKGPEYAWGDDKDLGTMHDPRADGISCIQFLMKSSILVHAIDELNRVYIDCFTCDKFDPKVAKAFSLEFWKGKIKAERLFERE